MRAAYADPPYIGQARKHYATQEICAEVNHRLLIAWLCDDFDCWALSASSTTLRTILALCPPDVRVGAWVKPFAVFKPNVNPAYAWEPIILWHGRKLGRDRSTVVDWVSANITMTKEVHGTKPDKFCFWLFSWMGLDSSDELVDVFPGSGAIGRNWEFWRSSPRLSIGMESESDSGRVAQHSWV